jgi:hypothetical protein
MEPSKLEILLDQNESTLKRRFLDNYEKVVRNRHLIVGLDPSSREAIGKTIASVQTFASDCTPPGVVQHRLPEYVKSVTAVSGSSQASLFNYAMAAMIAAFATKLSEKTLAQTAKGVAEASRINFPILGAMTGSAALAALDFSKFQQESGHIAAFENSYSGRLASVLRQVLNEREVTDQTIKPLEALIHMKIASLPQNRVSAEGMFTMFMTLLAVIISYETFRHNFPGGETLSPLHTRQLGYIVGGVLENTRRLIPQTDDNTYYRVVRHVGVTAKPKLRTNQLGILAPSQTVRLMDRNHKWIGVEYFDQIHGVSRYGWAPKKYFQQLPATATQPARVAPTETIGTLSDQDQKAITEDWEETNRRRINLIYKKAENKLTTDEKIELDRLQQLTDERIRQFAPLPLSAVESVLRDLKNLERRI